MSLRYALALAVLAAGLVAALVPEEPSPLALLAPPLLFAIMPRRRDRRRLGRADAIAAGITVGAIALTLLIPAGVARSVVLVVVTLAWFVSLEVLDPDRSARARRPVVAPDQ